jgi:MoxR-like ATPase
MSALEQRLTLGLSPETATPAVERTSTELLRDLRELAKREVAKVVIGHEQAVELMLVAAVAGGHILLEGPPGVAKTTLAGSVARVLGVHFGRVQFTPDTTPSEIVGHTARKLGEEVFVQGAAFTNVLLADEVNRTPPRTQAALLEAMQEGHVTVDGRTRWLPKPFLVIATQNPFEQEGVYPLPESQLDRFLFKVVLGYCSVEEEVDMLRLPHRGVASDVIEDVCPLLDAVKLTRAQDELDATTMPAAVSQFIVGVVRATRDQPGVVLGASPRAAMHLLAASKAAARLSGRDAVAVEDVVAMAHPVLRHRVVVDGPTPDEVVTAALESAGR